MSINEKIEAEICLDTDQGYAECQAVFDMTGEEGRFDIYVKAELVSAQFGGLKLDRYQVASITGADHLKDQEKKIADQFADSRKNRCAA